jgi:type III restriction enzyme
LSGYGEETGVFEQKQLLKQQFAKSAKDVKISAIEKHIIKNALAKNDFYNFDNLKQYFPKINSSDEFVCGKQYLGGLGITFEGTVSDLEHLSNESKFQAALKLLEEVENQIKSNTTEYKGTTEFKPTDFKLIFFDKKIKVTKGSEKADGQMSYVGDKDWYVFEANYGTKEEKDFVEFMGRQIEDLKTDFREIYLVRNERQLKIYNFKDGRAFEPDYLLFLTDKKGASLTYQLFIEPKGAHLLEHDKWKDDFLEEIRVKFKAKIFEFKKGAKYKVLGVPFYNSENENDFKEKLFNVLK